MHESKVRPHSPDENTDERESHAVRWDEIHPATRLGQALKNVRARDIEADASGFMNKKSWASREADALDIPDDSFSNLLHGESWPEGPRQDKLIARYGLRFLLDVYPVDPETDPLDDAMDAIQRARRQRDGGGG